MAVQHARQQELLAYYRARGHYVVAGGSYASLRPEKLLPCADTVIAGEAEKIWPAFCSDYEAGHPAPHYAEQGVVDLATSPVPRFDLLKMERYTTASLQFSRERMHIAIARSVRCRRGALFRRSGSISGISTRA